jgi:hypothetical protein
MPQIELLYKLPNFLKGERLQTISSVLLVGSEESEFTLSHTATRKQLQLLHRPGDGLGLQPLDLKIQKKREKKHTNKNKQNGDFTCSLVFLSLLRFVEDIETLDQVPTELSC